MTRWEESRQAPIRDPHAATGDATAGVPVADAKQVLVLLHGRGASAESMLSLFEELGLDDCAAVAPRAAGNTWYPRSFLAPLESNQPELDSALARVAGVVDRLVEGGVSAERIVLLGFSQGACLALEFAARHPRRYGGVVGLTGGLIGPDGTPRAYPGGFDGAPVFLGTSDPDPHVPFARVQETAAVFSGMGAAVELRRYPGMPHTINEEELEHVRALVRRADGR